MPGGRSHGGNEKYKLRPDRWKRKKASSWWQSARGGCHSYSGSPMMPAACMSVRRSPGTLPAKVMPAPETFQVPSRYLSSIRGNESGQIAGGASAANEDEHSGRSPRQAHHKMERTRNKLTWAHTRRRRHSNGAAQQLPGDKL